jgi:hypothetical protein
MSLRSILAALRSIPPFPRTRAGRRAGFRPRLEPMDERCLPSFSPAVNFGVGDFPHAVATGHFNNDDHLDLVTANQIDSTVSVRLGDGLGGFGAANPFATGTNPVSVAVGDFDNDGKLDLATANRGSGDVTVLLGDGLGDFAAPVSNWVASGVPSSLAVGDFNNDGLMDLAVGTKYTYSYGWGTYEYGYVEVLMNDGQGAFGTNNWFYIGSGAPGGLAVGDFDGDLLEDDVVAVNPSGTVFFGSDAGLEYAGEFATGSSPMAVAVGDFTGDGIPDLVTAGQTVSILQGDGAGGFTWISDTATGSWQTAVAATDLNGDGKLDVITAAQVVGTVSAFLGFGDGTLALVGDNAVGSSPRAVAVGDFNGDGRPDAATANAGSDNVSVLLNDGTWPPLNSPWLRVGDVTVTEGNTGTVVAEFIVTLSAPSTETVTVEWNTANGTATAGTDYQATSGTVTFAPGETSKSVAVLVIGDRLAEPNETFSLRLSQATNGFISDDQGVGTIRDDEPRISINSRSLPEGHNGTKGMTFTVTLSVAYDQLVTVNFMTRSGTATTGDRDYNATSGTLTFAPGETSKTITVKIRGDKKIEADQYFYLDLSGASSNSLLSISRGVGTIANDD